MINEKYMGKIISKYRGYTAEQIKARADIPRQSDMVVTGDYVSCTRLGISFIRKVIYGAASKVKALVGCSNINVWSGFGPTARTAVDHELVNSVPEAGSLGSFAGYNKDATPPGWIAPPAAEDIYVASGGSVTFEVSLIMGEVNWSDMGVIAVMLAVYAGTTLVGYEAVNLEDDEVGNELWISVTLPNQTIQREYTARVWLVDHLIDFTDSDIVCRLPNTTDFAKTVKILAATTVVFDAPEGFTAEVGYNNYPNNGTVFYNNLEGLATWDEVRVYASIWGYREGAIGSEILIDTFTPWHHDDFASGAGQPNGDYFIASSGYICTIRVEAINT